MFTDTCLQRVLDLLLNQAADSVKYHLFTNNYTVITSTDLIHFTEATNVNFPGYAPIGPLAEAFPSVNAGHEANTTGATLTWTTTGAPPAAIQIFGIFCTINDITGTPRLFAAWNFASPVTIAFTGDQVVKSMDFYAKNYAP